MHHKGQGDIAFNDPAVINAIEEFGAFAKRCLCGRWRRRCRRDRPPQQTSRQPKGAFCLAAAMLHAPSEASFIPAFFPEGAVIGQDADVFFVPAYAEKDLLCVQPAWRGRTACSSRWRLAGGWRYTVRNPHDTIGSCAASGVVLRLARIRNLGGMHHG